MKIFLTINSAWNIAHFRQPVIRALLDDGHDLIAVAPRDEAAERLGAMGCRFIDLPMDPKGRSALTEASLLAQIIGVLRTERPDLVLSWTIKNNIYFGLAGRLLGIPVVPNVSGLGTAFLSGRAMATIATMLYRVSFAQAPTVFFQNDADRDLFVDRRMVRPDQSHVLPGSGIDLEYFTPPATEFSPPGQAGFLMISRLLRDKGVVEYVDAARQIRRTHPEARFALLGPLGAANVTAISQQDLEDWVEEGVVEYLGTTNDVRPYIAKADWVVLPSYREGAPRVLLEAQAMARPVITTDAPGCRHVVESEKSAFLCEVKSADSLARAVRRFLELDQQERRQMGEAGRSLVSKKYDQSFVIEAYRQRIDSL